MAMNFHINTSTGTNFADISPDSLTPTPLDLLGEIDRRDVPSTNCQEIYEAVDDALKQATAQQEETLKKLIENLKTVTRGLMAEQDAKWRSYDPYSRNVLQYLSMGKV
ncbi:hypothetical protein HYALB_00008515 [Hymenoscyphus albidus]|uniref:Uncharacterized protein n=1 Tax=Hymenoscyphus albidus TaxID=595503 RepID=A0A9N9LP78_9HELO|nr:hypothetical protein HYALB_00008515 [Hymenoscyphus albidus]